MISAKSPNLAAEQDAAKAFLEFLVQGLDAVAFFANQPGHVPAANDADTSSYTRSRRRRVEIVGAPARSPSSSTATPAPTSPARTACRLPADFIANPTPGPDRVPEDDPGLLGLAAAERMTRTRSSIVADAATQRDQPAPPRPGARRRGARRPRTGAQAPLLAC